MPVPQIRACLVCEAARPEVLGKWTLLGFFGLSPDVRVNIADFALPVVLCFVFAGGEASGKYHAVLRVLAPSGAVLPGSEARGELLPGRPTSVFFMQFQAVVPEPGRYTVILALNGQDVFQTTCDLAQGSAADMRKQLSS